MMPSQFSRLTKALCFLLFAGIVFTACRKSNPLPGHEKTIYQTISHDQQYSFLTAAVNKAGLAGALDVSGDKTALLTLFAPTNAAFKAAGFNSVSDLAAVPDSTLKAILLYHVLGSKVNAADIPQAHNTSVTTLNGQSIFVTKTGSNAVFVNGVPVTKADIECRNGVIHQISRVLMPATGTIVETAIANPNLSLLVAAVLRASQGSTNVATVLSGAGPFTVFAPTNRAFINAGFADAAAALDAFKLLSVDYLLKPVTYDSLANAIDKLKRLHATSSIMIQDFSEVFQRLQQQLPKYKTRFIGKIGNRLFFMDTKNLQLFYADSKIVYFLSSDNTKYIVEYTLEQLEEMLDPSLFFRINRSMIVHIAAINQVRPYDNNRLQIVLHGSSRTAELIISRERVLDFRKWANN